ncbi:MAG: orotidine-5'-phosphate decarboxylase [Actinobacteria bacterium]|nr:MAG: orotidine-5'-phosphate decarboxylase [Actinomycetota bacterium]
MTTGLIVALDFPDVDQAMAIARGVRDHVDGFKVGHELLFGPDAAPVERVAGLGLPVFADAKLHDIPATVEAGARQLGRRGARWVTVHASGGRQMLEAAVAGLNEGSEGSAGVLAVSVLTSLGDDDLAAIGMMGEVGDQVSRLVALSASSGVEGVVCAVSEVATAKSTAPGLIAFTPGIRTGKEGVSDDQKRTSTVEEAVAAGSDYLVVGRPITRHSDPAGAAQSIKNQLSDSGMDGMG